MRIRPVMGKGKIRGPELGLSTGRPRTLSLALAPSPSPRRL